MTSGDLGIVNESIDLKKGGECSGFGIRWPGKADSFWIRVS